MTWQNDRRGVPSKVARAVMRAHGGICHQCGHPDAEQVDHVRNVASFEDRAQAEAFENLAPIHGAPCPTCHDACHTMKTGMEAAAARARILAKTRYNSGVHPAFRR